MAKNVLATDLVVEHVEAESRLRLRLAIELSLKGPDLFGCFKAHRQSPSPHHRRKHTRSQGPFLRRHYPASTVVRPCPTPARSTARNDVGRDFRSERVSLDYPHHHSNVPCPIPRRTEQVHVSIASLLVQPSPGKRRVGVRIDSFEAFSKLHSRYGPLDRSPAQGGLRHEASAQPVTRLRRS